MVKRDPDVSSAASDYNINPTFDPSKHLKVAFTSATNQDKLRNICIEKREEIGRSIEKRMTKRGIHAVSLDGTLLSKIYRYGRKDNIGVTLCVNNTLGTEDPPPRLKPAVDNIILYLALAFIKADLQEVFPSRPDEKNREEIEGGLLSLAFSLSSSSSSSSSSMLEESEEGSVEETSGKRMRIRRSPRVKSRKKQRTSTKVVHIFDDDDDGDNDEVDEENDSGFETREEKIGSKRREEGLHRPNPPKRHKVKQDTPSYDELEHLASKLDDVWKKLGRRLGIEEPKLDEVSKLNEELSEKGYKMLRCWKGLKGSAATYQILGQALQHELVNLRDLAEEFCYEQQ